MTELLPCPFCGSEADIVVYGATGEHTVECLECGAEGATEYDEAKAIEAWNTRIERTCFEDGCLCSSCGREFPHDMCSDWELNYCPNCGARVVDE